MDKRVKVLQLTTSLMIGGAERMIYSLAQGLNHDRFEVHVCSLHKLPHNGLDAAFKQLGLPLRVVGRRHFFDPRTIHAVAQYVRQREIDIIHTHVLDADVVGHIAGQLTHRPVVTTLHSVPHSYNRQQLYRRWLQRIVLRFLATKLITVSDRARHLFIQEWYIPENKIRTIYPTVSLGPYLALPEGTFSASQNQKPVVTNIGRLVPAKAQHVLLDAASLVLKQRPDAQFMIVGPGAREQQLKVQAQTLGIADDVTFAGARHDIPEILGQTDVFVLSSLWEGLPLTAIEAMAAARPVVLTDVGGNSELVEHGVQGLIVPPGNVEALADAILALLNNAPRRLNMGRAARLRVRDSFNLDNLSKQYEAVYESMLNR